VLDHLRSYKAAIIFTRTISFFPYEFPRSFIQQKRERRYTDRIEKEKENPKKRDYTIVHHPRFLQDQEYVRMQLQQRSDQMAWSLLGKKSFQ
jgi:hypothetical protein